MVDSGSFTLGMLMVSRWVSERSHGNIRMSALCNSCCNHYRHSITFAHSFRHRLLIPALPEIKCMQRSPGKRAS